MQLSNLQQYKLCRKIVITNQYAFKNNNNWNSMSPNIVSARTLSSFKNLVKFYKHLEPNILYNSIVTDKNKPGQYTQHY